MLSEILLYMKTNTNIKQISSLLTFTLFLQIFLKCRLMAKFILEGKVLKKLVKYKDSLLSLPVVMIKPWGNLHGERTQILLQKLIQHDVDSLHNLTQVMMKDNNFLKEAYLKWIPESLKFEVHDMWLDLLNE